MQFRLWWPAVRSLRGRAFSFRRAGDEAGSAPVIIAVETPTMWHTSLLRPAPQTSLSDFRNSRH